MILCSGGFMVFFIVLIFTYSAEWLFLWPAGRFQPVVAQAIYLYWQPFGPCCLPVHFFHSKIKSQIWTCGQFYTTRRGGKISSAQWGSKLGAYALLALHPSTQITRSQSPHGHIFILHGMEGNIIQHIAQNWNHMRISTITKVIGIEFHICGCVEK